MADTTRAVGLHKSAHVLPRDVFKTFVRLETKVDWRVSENEVAHQLNLPPTYVDPVPQFVKPRETFREGPFSQSTPTLPRPLPMVDSHLVHHRTAPPPKLQRRKNALRQPIPRLTQLLSSTKTSVDPAIISYTFPRGHRTDFVAYSTPANVSAATYDPRPDWAEEAEPPRVVVGSQPDGPEKVRALTMRLVELTATDSSPPTNRQHHADGTVPATRDDDGDTDSSAEDGRANPIAITIVLPAGLTLTYRVLATRTVASLKNAIAKKLSTTRTRETRLVPDGIVVPAMLSLYLQGQKLADSNALGDSGVHDRSSLIPETAFIDDEGVMVDWYFVMQAEQVVRKKKKIQHTNVMLFELRLQELAATRHASDIAVHWDDSINVLNEAALDALVRTLCVRESNMLALNPTLSISRQYGAGRFCLQELQPPRGNLRYVTRFASQPKTVGVIQTHYTRSLEVSHISQDQAPPGIEAILRQSVMQVVEHLRTQRDVMVDTMTLEWVFATPTGSRRDVPCLIGAQHIRGMDATPDNPKTEPFTKLKRELEDLRLPTKVDDPTAVHPRQVCMVILTIHGTLDGALE
ncbi:hypothetical protein DYB32_003328 [Aphanomyces invadans]|uniref:Ubiquitin-like domain-containing protein n=1 Tax=Aphanomyces invadans TaxID=157072 RepID=A0A418B0Z8_9STRA|nr:hypothetical protein DYB32_003328 [Aphanomyces invadans]